MTERPEFLEALETELLDGIPRSRRLRRNRRLAGGAVALVLLAGAGVAFASLSGEDEDPPVVVDTPTPTTEPTTPSTVSVPTTVTAVVPSTSAPPPTTVTAVILPLDNPHSIPGAVVAFGRDGLWARPTGLDGQPPTPMRAATTAMARIFVDGTIVSQAGIDDDSYPIRPTGPITVESATGATQRFIEPDPGREVRLLDAATVDGVPTLLYTSSVTQPGAPEDAEERLFMHDLDTGERTDLGVVGGWESGIEQARITQRGIAALTYEGVIISLDLLDTTGSIVDGIEIGEEQTWSLAAFPTGDFEVRVFNPGFDGSDSFRPVLASKLITLDGGVGDEVVDIVPDGFAIDAGFCHHADIGTFVLLCDQSSDHPIAIDLSSGDAVRVAGFERGALSTQALEFTGWGSPG